MSQKNLLHSGLVMPLCLLILIVCCACKPAGKETVEVGGLWPSYSLPTAVSAADYVVFGTVQGKGAPVETAFYPDSSGVPVRNCYREVTVRVTECAKGGLVPGDTVTYREMGGETKTRRYIYTDTEEAAVGDQVLVFIEDGYSLCPATLWIVSAAERTIPVECTLLPGTAAADSQAAAAAVSIEAMLDAVRELAALPD